MSVQLFRLRGVPDDEADEVRQLLHDNGIEYYETPPGNWGISMPALWLRDDSQLDEARGLIAAYQETRLAAARAERERLRASGGHQSIFDSIRENPLRFIAYAGIALVVLYFSTKPFLDLGK